MPPMTAKRSVFFPQRSDHPQKLADHCVARGHLSYAATDFSAGSFERISMRSHLGTPNVKCLGWVGVGLREPDFKGHHVSTFHCRLFLKF